MYDANFTKLTLPKPQVHASHPFRHKDNHDRLVNYLRHRLTRGKEHRDARLPRLVAIDKTMAGWMELSTDERKAAADALAKGKPNPTDVNLPLTAIHIEDMMTYFAQTFSPNRGMFYHSGTPEDTPAATQIVAIMNNHAIYAGYFRETLLTIHSLLKYNLGGFEMTWSTDYGPKLSATRELDVQTVPVWSGNRLKALDMYNTLWDPLTHPTEVYRRGEFAAKTEIVSHYELQYQASLGLYFNVESLLATPDGVTQTKYYLSPPTETLMANQPAAGMGGTDWVRILSENPNYSVKGGYEITTVYIRLNPTDFGLVPPGEKSVRNRYEIWRIKLCDDLVIAAQHMNNIHNYIPMFIGLINDDLLVESQKSVAETIAPLQSFASHLLNVHMRANRKNLWGITFYDSSVFDMSQVPPGEINARVPTRPEAAGRDLRQAVYRDDRILDTKQTMQDLAAVMDIINKFFPTSQLPSQIASIDRAVDSQVAAVQQGSNRRNQKTARLLDDSLFRPLRFGLYYNIVQYQEDGAQVTDFYGKPIKVNLSELRATDLPFIIGQGLKAIDRQAAASMLKEIIFVLMQNPLAAQEMGVGLLDLIDYWTSMIDIEVDMKQFRKGTKPAPDQPPPQATGSVL